MTLGVRTSLKKVSTERVDSTPFGDTWAVSEACPNAIKVIYEVPATWNNQTPLLEISPTN